MPSPKWKSLQKAADLKRKGADHLAAIELYTQALANSDVPWTATVKMTFSAAFSHRMLGQIELADKLLTRIAEKALEEDEDTTAVKAYGELIYVLRKVGDYKRVLDIAQKTLELANKTNQPGLQAEAFLALGLIQNDMGRNKEAEDSLTKALPLIDSDDKIMVLKAHYLQGFILGHGGKFQELVLSNAQALEIARGIGDFDWEGVFLNQLSLFTADLAFKRKLFDQALHAFKTIGNELFYQAVLFNRTTLDYEMGLYKPAEETIRQLYADNRSKGLEAMSLNILLYLGLCSIGRRNISAAFDYFNEGASLARNIEAIDMQFGFILSIAYCFSLSQEPQKALEMIQQVDTLSYQPNDINRAWRLSHRALAHVLSGDYQIARYDANQALIQVKKMSENLQLSSGTESLYWNCYRGLHPSPEVNGKRKKISKNAWNALELGIKSIRVPIQNISDSGLKRGYLHRNIIRRLIILEWLEHADSNGVSAKHIVEFTTDVQKSGRLDEVFTRLLKAGLRLNSERDPSLLPDEIVDEVDELIGAERIALVLVDEQGRRQVAKALLPLPVYSALSGKDETEPDYGAFKAEIEPWVAQAVETQTGFIQQLNTDAKLTKQLGILVSPLISQGKLIGVIYCDIRGCFGRFDPEDLNLLTVLANQSALALENADWSATLEKKVEQRTGELEQSNERLEQSNAELAIINSIQQGLAKELDFQAIIDLVGDKLREVFEFSDMMISWYDEINDTAHHLYLYDRGERVNVAPTKLSTPGSLFNQFSKNRAPDVWNNKAERGKAPTAPGSSTSTSGIAVPIVSSDKLIGAIQLFDIARENAYGESEQRLLTTVAASLGTTLENARLFDETQRLLKETEQRNAELAILNSVSDALSKDLNVDAIIKIVGDQVRDTFKAEVTSIHFYDTKSNLITTPYYFDKGYVATVSPFPLGKGMTSIVIQKREPLLLLTVEQEYEAGGIAVTDATGGGGDTKSYLGVPIIVGDNVMGVVSVQSYEEYAFQQSHVNLLSTLASTMGVAIQNARQFQAEQERIAELQIINSIQQGLAKELDFQAIVDLVGDKLRQVLQTGDMGIGWYDEKNNQLHVLYGYEHGKRLILEPRPPVPNGVFEQIRAYRQPMIANTIEDFEGVTEHIPGTDTAKSSIVIPIISSDRVLGFINIDNFEREYAFGAAETRLLTTIAASLGTALENARLFNETQRLLKETEQRNAELAVINTVQAALAAELNIQGIYDAVGDKIREIFHTGNVAIRIYDPSTQSLSFPYQYERGERISIEPMPLPEKGFSSHVIRNRETVVINENLEQISREYGSYTIPGTLVDKSAVFVPLVVGDQGRGLVYLSDFEHEHAFNESDVRLLQTLVNSMSVALENARLFDETQRLLKETEQRNAELAILNSVSEALSRNLNVDAIIKIVGDQVRDTFKSEVTTIHLFDSKTHVITNPYAYDRGYITTPPMTYGEGLTSIVIRTREPLVLLSSVDAQKIGTIIVDSATGESGDTESYLGVPIIIGENVIGVVTVQSYQKNAYQQNHISLLSTLASTMGVAIQNARQFQAEQERVSELQIINSIQKGLAAELDFQAIVDLVGDKLRELFKTGDLGITWFDEKANLVHYLYTFEHNKRIYSSPTPPSLGGIYETEMKSRQPYIMSSEDLAKTMPMPGTDRSLSAIFIPIISSDRFLGDISIEDFEHENAFGEAEIRLLTTIAASLGTALENARLFDETQRLLKETEQRNAELAIINSVQAALAAELNIQGIYDAVGDKIRQIFHSNNINIRIYDTKTSQVFIPYSYENGERIWMEPIRVTDENRNKGFTGYVISHRETLVINEHMDQAMEKYSSVIMPGTQAEKSSVYVPLIVGDQAFGLIHLYNMERENAFSDSDVRLLQTLANSMSVALENARLFDETQRLLKETEQRAAELAILNSVGEAMSRQLDIKTITNLVGDKVKDIFSADTVMISLYNPETDFFHPPYLFDKGYIDTDATDIYDGYAADEPIFKPIIYERKSLLFGTSQELIAAGANIFPDAEGGSGLTSSFIGVPIIVGERVKGLVNVQSYREHAYDSSNLRLLSTLASSMGVAIENARLFQETQRLLDETQQRNSELAIINSVQAALAAELNIQGIYDAVGDKIREIFHSENLEIRIWDLTTNLESTPYLYEYGERLVMEPRPIPDTGFGRHVFRTRETLLINENMHQVMEKFGSFTYPGTSAAKSAVYVPLIVGDQARGLVLLSDFEREHAFSDSNVRLLQTLVNSMSVALENARLFSETQRLLAETEQRNSELAIINSVQAALAAELNIQGIYNAVGDKIREIFHSENLEIRLWDTKAGLEYMPYLYENGERLEIEPNLIDKRGISYHVWQTRQTLVINENLMRELEKYDSYIVAGTQAPKSAVYVPLIVGDQARGLVALSDFTRENAFNESDVRLLQTLVNSMSVALENARLFDETQRLLAETEQRNSELAIINSVQAALAAELNIQGIYEAVGDKIREIFHSENLEIRIFNSLTNQEQFPYLYEKGERIYQEPLPREEKGFAAHIARTRETVVINENTIKEAEKYGSYLMPGTSSPLSVVYVPLIVGDQVRGLVGLSDFEHEHAFSDSDIRLLQTLVNSMSVALENARLFDETQRLLEETSQRANELSIINHVSQAMSRQLQVDAIVHTVGDQIRDSLHSEVVNIYLYDPASNMVNMPYSYDRKYVESEPFQFGVGLTSKVIQSKEHLILGSFDDIRDCGALLSPNSPVDELMPQSYLGVPIIVGEKAIGAVDVQSYKQCVYDDSHVRLLSTLASSMGVALENARLFEETRRLLAETEQRNRELAIISRIGQALAGQLDPQGIFELVGAELQKVFDTQMVGIITYDRQENLAHWRYFIEKGKRQTVTPHAPAGFLGHILQTRKPILITHDLTEKAEAFGSTVLAGETPKSYLGVPLIAGGEVTGVITLQNIDREGAFSENDLRLLSTLALSMGVALENARLYQETQHHAVEMAALAEIGSDIASTHEMEPVLERMATKTRQLMQVRDIAMYLLQPDGHTLKPIVSQGKYGAETMSQPISIGVGMTGSIVRSGVAEIINEPERDPRAIHIEGTASEDEEQECIMIAPLISRSKVIGAMSVYRDRDQGIFTQLELDFLISLARQAAIAIESARLYAETERRATEMAALAEVSREISATLELQVVLERIAGQARELLAAGNSAVYLLQPDGITIKAITAEGDIAQEVLADEVKLGNGIIGNIVKSGIAEWVNDTAKDPRAVQIAGTADIGEGEKLLVAPLLIQDRAIGALAVWRDPDDPTFNQAELSFSIGLAQQAAVAIENARLFESAQESQRRMADIIDFLPDATFVVDREGKVIAWNHAIEEMTGVKAPDILGQGDHAYALPFYNERRPFLIDTVLLPDEEIEKNYAHIQRNEGVLMDEAVVPQFHGRTTYLNATASALRNARGEVVGAIETIRDVTDQKMAEQELHQAKAEAEAANQAKSAFLAMMSHEIRTPMNAIIGMSGLLMDTPLNPDQKEFAETIRSSGDSLLTIINDILDFSKIEAGKMTLEEAAFDLRECVETSLDLIKVRASEKRLELAYQIDPGVPAAIMGDVTRLRQVLINLLGNSVKFTEQGEIILSVSPGEQPDSLHFSVRDTGIGIPSDRFGLLFRAFTQADASTSRRYGGTGLGLALSNRIVELMGGRMWVESEGIPGKGSTFHFIIYGKPAAGWRGHPQMEGEHPQLRGKRLLIVDDNATNRRILQLQTQAWGMLPVESAGGEEALERFRRGERFDLTIIDLSMPDMNGVELAEEIRKLERSEAGAERLRLVLSTSLGGREEARESAEFSAILLKPIRQSALFDLLMSLFSRQPEQEAKQPAERPTLDPQMAYRHPLRILLAEDNVVNQKLALRLLSQMGYRADVAANGLEVLQAVKRQPYDVILMDVQMPEMDGLEATRRLCAELAPGKRPRIIAMTANAMQGDREMCLEAGMDDYLSKPIHVDELVNALNLVRPLVEGT